MNALTLVERAELLIRAAEVAADVDGDIASDLLLQVGKLLGAVGANETTDGPAAEEGWILGTLRLPEPGQLVEAFCEAGLVRRAELLVIHGEISWVSLFQDRRYQLSGVTHWRPLAESLCDEAAGPTAR